MRSLILTIAASLALSLCAQTIDDLRVIINRENAACPVTINKGLVQKSVVLNDTAIVYTIQVDSTVIKLQSIEQRSELIRDGKTMELATDANSDAFAPYCTKLDISIIYLFTDGTTSFTIPITPSDMSF